MFVSRSHTLYAVAGHFVNKVFGVCEFWVVSPIPQPSSLHSFGHPVPNTSTRCITRDQNVETVAVSGNRLGNVGVAETVHRDAFR